MKRAALVTLCFILGVFTGTSFATEVTLLGPNQYVRTSGAPDVFTGSFSGVLGSGRLIVKNGSLDGTDRISDAISSASVYVNGDQIFGPSDFKQNAYLLQAPVDLWENNSITVELASGPGSYLTIEIKEEIHPPTVSLSADNTTILSREHATLTWSSTTADDCVIEPGIGPVGVTGSVQVSPAETTTYTITAAGLGGTATAGITITVNKTSQPPLINFSSNPVSIASGESSTLTWTSSNAQNAFIDNGVGSVPLNGSITVSPGHTTTYAITVTGSTGSNSTNVKIQVMGNPAPLPEGAFGDQYQALVPIDATVEEYDPKRFSLITGLVRSIDDSSLPGVSVTLHHRPEYGTVSTDEHGRFSLPVEGGTTLTVVYQKDGFIPAHRKVYVPWNDIGIAETIRMMAEDPVATTVTFNGNPDTVMTHQGTEVSDDFGSRSVTLVFTGDNQAYLVDEDGNDVHELTTITARATEFETPESMPAKLPPNSAYTYCVELAVDGARRVRFDKPVITWVENFLGFEVGEIVPVGYYDRDRGFWVPSDNGVVVKLLDTDGDGIVDALDSDGDNQPDDLDGDGSFGSEVLGLEDPSRYVPGATFWRVSITHFTPWDFNWPYGPPPDAIPPNPKGIPTTDQQVDDQKDCRSYHSSSVEERSRIFHEDIPLPGTDMTLHYASNRVKGHKTVISVPVSGETIPASLKNIIVKVQVAGRTFEQILEPLPDQNAEFAWDGLDYAGRSLDVATAYVSIGFVYEMIYYSASDAFAQSFAQAGDSLTLTRGRQDIISWKYSSLVIYPTNREDIGTIAKGWTLSSHHFLSRIKAATLYKGDGSVVRDNVNIKTVHTRVAGGRWEYCGDGGPATQACLGVPKGVTMDAAGNLFISDPNNLRIRRVDTDGIITTVAGGGENFSNGIPAIEARLFYPTNSVVDPAGNLYLNDGIIWKVDTNGIINAVAGWGGYSGIDGVPAKDSRLTGPSGIAMDSAGNLYIAETLNHRIRKVDTNGIISTVAGNGAAGFSGDGDPAIEAQIDSPQGVAVDSEGNLYFSDNYNNRIRKVDISGIITTVAGIGFYGALGDGGPATQARLDRPYGLTIDNKGNLYIVESLSDRVRKVNTNGIITTVAGYPYDITDFGVCLDPLGNLYVADQKNYQLIKISYPSVLYDYTISGYVIFAEKGVGYVINKSGQHHVTIDLVTGVILSEFGYDENLNLISVIDQFGNKITINRDGNGEPVSIISPDGLMTRLTIDSDNHLTRITYPDDSFYTFEYTSEGLMKEKINQIGNRFYHAFDLAGKLTDATDEEGGHWNYTKNVFANGDILIKVTTGEGNVTSYLDITDSIGAYASIITDPAGAEIFFTQSDDGLAVTKVLPCGIKFEFLYGIDDHYKYKFLNKIRENTPGGLQKITTKDKIYLDTDGEGTPDLITHRVVVNGKITKMDHNTLLSQKTITSPEGRTLTSFYDTANLLTLSVNTPGLHDITYGYDSRGRLTSLAAGTRQTTFTYNSQGFLEAVTDPENHTTTYEYNPVGRVTAVSRPDTSTLFFDYDANGNMTVLTNPVSIEHNFGYNKVNLQRRYQTPVSGNYSYLFDKDRRLMQTTFPSGKQINNIYDTTQLVQVQASEGDIDLASLCGNTVGSISRGLESIDYGYDGSLITSEILSGTMSQSLHYTYNNDFNVVSFSYAGETESYTYDNDGLLTGSGNFTISRNAQNGLPEAVSGGSISLSRQFNGYGEPDSQIARVNSQNRYQWDLIRDNNGRITQKTETLNGTTSTFLYSYDSMGRLLTVTRDGVPVEQYQYDFNGARVTDTNFLRGLFGRSMSYSDEDHLSTAGGVIYNYDLDGFLTAKTNGSDITSYIYSIRSELLNVTLPDGKLIEYTHDPLGRRIARKVNGTTEEKYLWQGLTRLLAVYDGNNNLLIRFKYADERMPVAMTRSDGTYYLLYDQVGSLRLVTDYYSNPVKTIDYDSFGNIINDSNPSFKVPFGFAGGLHDLDTGLVRFGYRDYDPDVGRWTAKDPIFFAGGDTDLYGYCLNDPVNLIDPDGLIVGSLSIKIGHAILGRTIGASTEGAYVAGKVADSTIGISISANILPRVLTDFMGPAGHVLQMIGGGQTFGLGVLIAGASSTVALPVALAGLAGVEIGLGFNSIFEYISGQPLGADIYDWFHSEAPCK